MKGTRDQWAVTGLVALSLAEGLTHFGQSYVDSGDYIQVALFFSGKMSQFTGLGRWRLLRPVVPFLASLLGHVMTLRVAFGAVNLVFWCASAVLMFYFTKLLTNDIRSAAISAVFLSSAIPLLILGAAVYTDMAGYFFILLCAFIILRWDLPRANLKRIILASLIVEIGMLSRETVAYVLLFALLYCLLTRGSFPRIIVFVGIVVGLSALWATLAGLSYTNWIVVSGVNASPYPREGLLSGAQELLRSVLYAFGEYPIVLALFVLGFLRVSDLRKLKVYLSLLIPAILLLAVWPVPGTRYSFMLFPAVLPLAGFGVEEAYDFVVKSALVSTIWPSFKGSSRYLLVFQWLIVAVYVIMTNLITRSYVSFPWNPLIDPSLPPSLIQWLRNY